VTEPSGGGPLAGRNALVTGASRGIGRAIAEAFAAAGAQVMISSRKAAALEQVAREAGDRGLPGRIIWQAAHAGKPAEAQACVAETVRRLGSVDILVANAATNPYFGDLAGLDVARAEKTFQVNQLGVLTWAQQAWQASMRQHGGVIINVASIGGFMVEPMIGFYNVTKAAVIQLTRQLAYEMAPGVRVNAIAPGLVKTDMARGLWEGREPEQARRIPLRRLGETADIASAAVFLASDAASWITGHTLVVDGGAMVAPSVAGEDQVGEL
jgi:NAD(P)-dependent dehydrogenase (short-subunit alcohol dehydrogenase family)